MTSSSKITIHMVASLDGFIAKKDNNVDWFQSSDHYENGISLTEEEMAAFVNKIDCYVMGSHTYEHALELGWPYGSTPVIVLTHRKLTTRKESVTFYSGDLNNLVNDKLKSNYKNIWLVGGASLVKDFLQQKLADEIIISIMPVILGDGILFFNYIGQEQRLHLKNVTAYNDGMVELSYEIKKQ